MKPLTGHRDGSPRLVGRSRERDLIRAQLDAALAGQGGLVVLSGEAGIGKTALAEETCRAACAAGARVLTGHCYDHGETPPYGPWGELLEQIRSDPDRAGPVTIPEPRLTGSPSQDALFDELRAYLAAIASERPLVILLEDLHWADDASLDFLRFVGRRLASLSILLLMTFRTDEVGRGHPLYRLLPLLVREALAVRIDLALLSDDDARQLVEHAYQLPSDDAGRLASYLQTHAEGNPFFLGELLRSLEGTTLRRLDGGGWALGPLARIPVPMLLRQVIDARLARLGPEADAKLAVAAVIGEVVPLALWAEVCGTTEADLLSLVERAVDARVLDATPDGVAVRFAHALLREALYEGVLPPRRRAWHRAIGDALVAQQRFPDADAVADHFQQAGDPRAAYWLTRAGERAQRAFAWGTAVRRFEAALAALNDDDTARNPRGWLLFRLALLRRFVDPAGGAAALGEAERLGAATGDAGLVAYARFYRGMLRRMAGHFREGNALTEEGIALLDALSVADRDRLAAIDTTSDPLDAQNGRGDLALALGETGPFAQAVALGERIVGLPLSETTGSRGDAYYGLAYAYAALGEPEKARRAFARARAIFHATGHRTMVMTTLFEELVLVVHPYQTDRSEERQRLESELEESFTTLDAVFDSRSARTARVLSAVLEGAYAEVLAILEESGLRMQRLLSTTLIAPLARHHGDAALAWALVHEALPDGPETALGDSASYILPLRMLAVALALDAGDHDVAWRWLDSLDRWLDWSGGVYGRAAAHLGWAAYHRATGDGVAAQARAEQALAAAGAPRQPLALLAAHRLLGELALAAGRPDDAERQLAAALVLADACGTRHERALILLAQADLARVRGEYAVARAHLAAVRALCVPMGAAQTLGRADALAARLPAMPAGDSSSLPAELTAREGEVLCLLASGLSNAKIADRLSLSPRTINAHLTNIYSKLDVSSRGAAIRFALDHDLG